MLGTTHDLDELLQALLETAVEATRAAGGRLARPGGRVAEVGDPDAAGDRFELPLTAGRITFGTIHLNAPSFQIHDIEAASLLVGHGVIALENARLQRILERQALVDDLTGLANRRAAERALSAEVARANRFGGPLALVMADLDDFKAVNDRHGHLVGDAALRELAAALEVTLREIDTAARWGGEEFCLILPGTDARGAKRVAERVREDLAGRTVETLAGEPLRVTASFGVAVVEHDGIPETLVAAADAALYDAKRSGKNRVAIAAGTEYPKSTESV